MKSVAALLERGELLRVCIDARQISGAETGVASYSRNLVSALNAQSIEPIRLVSTRTVETAPRGGIFAAMGRAAIAARPSVRLGQALGDGEFLVADVFRQAQRFFDIRGIALPVMLPGPPGVMHWTYPMPIHAIGWRNVYTIHDLIPILQPELTPIDRRRHARLLRAVTRRASRIVTVSQTVRHDIVDFLGCDPDFVVDCGQGIAPSAEIAPLPPNLRPDSYFIALGSIELRKNLERLAHAFGRSQTQRSLIIAGPCGWQAERIELAVSAISGVSVMHGLAHDVVAALVANARALLMPSLAEGFGLPIIEAMLAGTPVMTSAFGATREVAADAALLVDPLDCDAMAAGITCLDRNVEFCDSLRQAGRKRALAFSREQHGEAVLRVYRREAAVLRSGLQ